MKNKLDAQIAARQAEADALNTKLLYLETTRKNSQQHIDQLLKQGHRNA